MFLKTYAVLKSISSAMRYAQRTLHFLIHFGVLLMSHFRRAYVPGGSDSRTGHVAPFETFGGDLMPLSSNIEETLGTGLQTHKR